MKENQRKCLKCGRSPADDPSVKLFRFPQPGIRNTFRCESWVKYCFPNEECSTKFQIQLYAEHRMLCDQHFKISSFIDFSTRKLHRYAVPEDTSIKRIVVHVPSANEPTAGPSRPSLEDITNVPSAKSAVQIVSPATLSCTLEPVTSPSPIQHARSATDPIASPSRPALVDPKNAHSENSAVIQNVPETFPRAMEPEAGLPHMQQIKQSKGVSHTKDINESKQRYLYMKCRKNMKKICNLRNRIHKLKNKVILKSIESDDALKILTKKITPTLALLLQGEIKNFKSKPKGRRWTKEQKITALRLYKRSPTCYHLLRRLFCLPAPSTLKKLLNHFPLRVGINEKIFRILRKFSTTQEPIDNEYILMFDEMSIRKHLHYNKKDDVIEGFQDHGNQGRSPQIASHALVFMICGIRKMLKQPVAFYLSGSSVTADRLAVLIKEVLYHCFEAQINITATVCDMDGVNRRALGILGATSQNPCIEIHDRTITTMFDVPHLLKCFRNLFMKYDIKHSTNISSGDTTGKGIAKWIHIQKFYELDNLNPNFVFAPSLRQEHLNPNTKQKMRVKLAAQILSHSVAAGMYCKISQGELPAEATITANLVANMDRLFDCLNSNTPDWRGGKPHSTNMTEKTPHLKLFKEMKLLFQSLKLIGSRSRPPSMEGWVWTLTAVEIFWRKLKTRHRNIRSLATRRLQQDPLENLFGCIRAHCGSNTNPTAGQFIAGLKTAVLSSLANVGACGNCERDENEAMLDNLKMLLAPSFETKNYTSSDLLVHLEENVEKQFKESMREVNAEVQACAYVCGFLIKQHKIDCATCKQCLIAKDVDLEHNFVDMKEYSELKRTLKYASKKLIACVEYCATAINKFLETQSDMNNMRQTIVNCLMNSANFDFLTCTSHKQNNMQYLTSSTFYICIKRFCILKNRKFIEEASATALRKKINILKHTRHTDRNQTVLNAQILTTNDIYVLNNEVYLPSI